MQINDNHFTRYVNVSKTFIEWYLIQSFKNATLLLLNITHVAVVIVVVGDNIILQEHSITTLEYYSCSCSNSCSKRE